MWFKQLVGFDEIDPNQVRAHLEVKDTMLTSLVNGRRFQHGTLETPSLGELRQQAGALLNNSDSQNNTLKEIVANVEDLHRNPENAGSLFQVASQFNLLEMVGPTVTPENGVDIYERDFTQGPACAIACGAGTIYRNYLVSLPSGQIGQTASNQIDCLNDLGLALGNSDSKLWLMENGYAIASKAGLQRIRDTLNQQNECERDRHRSLLRIGLQWQTEVTISGGGHLVSQAYCSALPVAYSTRSPEEWEPFARLVLEAAYEATLLAAIINRNITGNPNLYLTLLGGGAFGNQLTWILDAISRALDAVPPSGLDITMVSYGQSDPTIRDFVESSEKRH